MQGGGARSLDPADTRQTQRAGGRFGLLESRRVCPVHQCRNHCELWNGTAQQLQALAVELGVHKGEAGIVSAWPRETGGEPAFDRVHHDRGHDRNAAARVYSAGGSDTLCHNDVDRQCHQFCCQLRPERRIASGEAKFEEDIAAFDIPEIAQPLSEGIEHWPSLVVRHCQDADAGDLRRGLRA